MPLTAGTITSRLIRAWSARGTTGAGEYAPMPPVFGPASPSRSRLWSWLDASGSTFRPSTITMKLASSPSRKSSTTTRAPAAPSSPPDSIASTAACASSTVVATTTPFPAARPSALTTIGTPRSETYARAAAASENVRYCAVGMPCRAMKAFAKSFELSSCAAACTGPKIASPAARNASTMPAASGASGPTTVSATFCSRANATRSGNAVSATLATAGSSAVPALPGATKTFATRGDCASFQASACSRPPPPMTRTFTAPTSIERDLAEHVEDAAVVDPAVQRRDVGREHREAIVAQREQRQQRRKRRSAPDVLSRDQHQRVAEPGLQRVARPPVRGPAVAQVELGLVVRVAEDQEVDGVRVAVFALDAPRPAAAPGVGVLLGAAVGRPGPRRVPCVPGQEDLVLPVVVGVDDAPACLVEPFPEVGASGRGAGRQRERGRERRQHDQDAQTVHWGCPPQKRANAGNGGRP